MHAIIYYFKSYCIETVKNNCTTEQKMSEYNYPPIKENTTGSGLVSLQRKYCLKFLRNRKN